jgi:hypothetical protein
LPKIKTADWIMTCLLGFVIVLVFGAACLHVATVGGPEWIAGEEVEIFLKFAALTAAAVVAEICWKAVAPGRRTE